MIVPDGFAKDWQAAWNAHDLPRILAHYAEGIVFHSAKAAALVGTGTLNGKHALAAYWGKALASQPDLRFEVEEVFHGHMMLVILYINHKGVRAAETLRFAPDGLVVEASACHGVTP
jgi:ketosteroid isomerase-like protein